MAGSIESLKFDVILEDKNFKTLVQQDIDLAERLNTTLAGVMQIKGTRQIISSTGVANAKNMVTYLEQIENKIKNMPKGTFLVGDADKLNETLKLVNANLDKMIAKQKEGAAATKLNNSALLRTSTILQSLTQITGVAFSVVGLRRFLSSLIDITGQFEVQRMALRNMLQDIDGADKIFEDLFRFSSESTYRFSELAKYAKQLAAFNIGKNELLETTKMLGDVASGVGTSMDRLILAYGHVKSSGFLRGIQLRSFSQNGVPILEELSKMFTEIEGKAVSLGDVFDKMTKREIPFEMVEQAFRNMTSEGGKFYQMQEVLAKTLAGQINILKGRWENLLAAIGQSNSGVLKDTVAWMSNLVSSTENVGRLLTEVAVAFGAYKAAVLLGTLVTEGFGTVLLNVGIALEKFYLKLMNNPYAIIGVAAAAAGVAIYQYATAVSDAEKITETAQNGVKKYESALVSEQAELDRLYAKLNLATEGTDEYARAKNDIYNRFGPYIQQLHEEGVAVDNLASIYENLTNKIRESLQAKFLESESSALKKSLESATNNIYESFKKTAESIGWSVQQQEDIWRYIVTGNLKDKSLESELKRNGGGTIGIPGTFLYKDMGQSAESLRSLMQQSLDAFDESMKDIDDTFKSEADEVADTTRNVDADAKGWRGAVQKAIKDMSADTLKKTGLAAKEGEGYYEYIERIGKTSQELTKERDLALKAEKKEKEDLLAAIKTVDKALEGNILKDARYTKTPWNGSGSDPNKKERDDIKRSIALLEKFKSAYDKLEPIIGGNAAKAWVFNKMGKDVSNIDEELEKLIADLRKLGKEGDDAADAIEARLGLDEASKAYKQFVKDQKAADDAQKSLQKYINTLQDWADKNQELSGTGAAYNVSKSISTYRKALAAADKQAKSAYKELIYGTTDEYARLSGYANISAQWANSRANALVTLRNDITKYADDILKEQLGGYDLSNWNDKTLSQINDIRDAISRVRVPDEIKLLLKDFPQLLAVLENELKWVKQDIISNTIEPERFKKVSGYAKKLSGYLGTAAAKMRDLAEASGNTKLQGAAEVMGMLAQNMQAAADGAEAWGGYWGAIIGGLTDLIDQVVSGLAEAAKSSLELANTVRVIRDDAFIAAQKSLFTNEGIFGKDGIKNIRGAVEAMKNLRDSMSALGDPEIERAMSFWDKVSLGWRLMFNPSHIAPEEFTKQGGLLDVIRQYGLNMYDAYGNIDPASIRKVIEMFGDQDGVLDKLAKDSEAYAEAMKVVEGTMEELFGDIASSMADNIVDSWIEAGSAALDYADILDDVARSYAKMLIQSTIMGSFLDPITEDLKKSFLAGDYETAMAMIAGAMDSVADSAPMFEQILSAFDPYFKREGSESSSLGSGIKSITEDTANLLASYINAIRADVSIMRGLQEAGWRSVAAIAERVASPTLNDYLAQCAANTFDIAQSSQSILSELQSVIGSPGTSGMVVRVEYA